MYSINTLGLISLHFAINSKLSLIQIGTSIFNKEINQLPTLCLLGLTKTKLRETKHISLSENQQFLKHEGGHVRSCNTTI